MDRGNFQVPPTLAGSPWGNPGENRRTEEAQYLCKHCPEPAQCSVHRNLKNHLVYGWVESPIEVWPLPAICLTSILGTARMTNGRNDGESCDPNIPIDE